MVSGRLLLQSRELTTRDDQSSTLASHQLCNNCMVWSLLQIASALHCCLQASNYQPVLLRSRRLTVVSCQDCRLPNNCAMWSLLQIMPFLHTLSAGVQPPIAALALHPSGQEIGCCFTSTQIRQILPHSDLVFSYSVWP